MTDTVFNVKFFGVSWRPFASVNWSKRHYRTARGGGYSLKTLCGLRVPVDEKAELSDGLPADGVCVQCLAKMRHA